MHEQLTQIGAVARLGPANVFLAEDQWFDAFNRALAHAKNLSQSTPSGAAS